MKPKAYCAICLSPIWFGVCWRCFYARLLNLRRAYQLQTQASKLYNMQSGVFCTNIGSFPYCEGFMSMYAPKEGMHMGFVKIESGVRFYKTYAKAYYITLEPTLVEYGNKIPYSSHTFWVDLGDTLRKGAEKAFENRLRTCPTCKRTGNDYSCCIIGIGPEVPNPKSEQVKPVCDTPAVLSSGVVISG